MSSPSNHHQIPQDLQSAPISRVDVPCLLHGSVGVAVALILEFVGLFQKGDDRLIGCLLKPVFHGQMPEVVPFPLLLLVTAVFCFGLSFVILDTSGTWKRVIMGVTVLVLIVAMLPTFAVWNLYFSPFLPVVGVFWSWFCTMMYANHHVMPCEVPVPQLQTPNTKLQRPKGEEQISKNEPQKTNTQVTKVDVVEEKEKVVADVNQKYKPKEKVDG